MKDKLEQVLSRLDEIQYGFVDEAGHVYTDKLPNFAQLFDQKYRLPTPERLLPTKYGVCWEQVELARYYLARAGIQAQSYYMIAQQHPQQTTHTFLVVGKNIGGWSIRGACIEVSMNMKRWMSF